MNRDLLIVINNSWANDGPPLPLSLRLARRPKGKRYGHGYGNLISAAAPCNSQLEIAITSEITDQLMLYPGKKPEIFDNNGAQYLLVHPGNTVDSYTIIEFFFKYLPTIIVAFKSIFCYFPQQVEVLI